MNLSVLAIVGESKSRSQREAGAFVGSGS